MATLRARIETLESRRRDRPRGPHGVVVARPGESLADADERVGGACLVVPGIMELDDWLAMTAADHRIREARNYELVGDILAARPRDTAAAITR